MILKFKGTETIKHYRGDGLYCTVANPKSCIIDIPIEHAKRLTEEHAELWEIPPKTQEALDNLYRDIAAGTDGSKVKMKFIGSRNRQYYRGDGVFCDADDPKKNIIIVNKQKATQILRDMPDLWEIIAGKENIPIEEEFKIQKPIIDEKAINKPKIEKIKDKPKAENITTEKPKKGLFSKSDKKENSNPDKKD